jgi:hypothetical protein
MRAIDAERIGIDEQLRPTVQAFGAEFDQRQAAQRGELDALGCVEYQVADRA